MLTIRENEDVQTDRQPTERTIAATARQPTGRLQLTARLQSSRRLTGRTTGGREQFVIMNRSSSGKISLIRVESARNVGQANKLARSVTVALSDMEQLMKSARTNRSLSRSRAPGCDCCCHLLDDVTISPRQAVFSAKGGVNTHILSNTSKSTIAVKITCSDNALYRVNPVFAVLEPGRCITLHIGRLEASPKKDRLCILLLEHNDSKLSAKEAFKLSAVRPTAMCVPLVVTEEDED